MEERKGRKGEGGREEGKGGREMEGGACVTQILEGVQTIKYHFEPIACYLLMCIVGHYLCNTPASVLPVCISSCNLSADLF